MPMNSPLSTHADENLSIFKCMFSTVRTKSLVCRSPGDQVGRLNPEHEDGCLGYLQFCTEWCP